MLNGSDGGKGMKIRILGCSGAVAKGYNTTSILVNDNVLVDAGSAASELDFTQLRMIGNIFLTHAHIDHIKELPFILDAICSQSSAGLDIWGSAITIEALREHFFNGLLWPTLEQLGLDSGKCRFNVMTEEIMEIDGLKVKSIDALHSPGAYSYIISQSDKHVIFSGDTSCNKALFDEALSLSDGLKLFFVEASFPDSMNDIAGLSGHMTPEIIHSEMKHFKDTRFIAYHIKPRFFEEVLKDIPEGMEYIKGGEVFEV